jgi:hypothetical protein
MSQDTAVLTGASMAGLLATRALSDHLRRIVVVERGDLPDRRRGSAGRWR